MKRNNLKFLFFPDGCDNHRQMEPDEESRITHAASFVSLLSGSSVLSTEDDLAVSLHFLNFGSSPPSSAEDSGLSSFVENPQYFCGIIKETDMCE